MSDWPPEMDAVIAAPAHHRVLLENDLVRVLETIVEPGETVPLHTHRWPAVTYFRSTTDLVRRDENGTVLMDTRLLSGPLPVGQAVWTPPLGLHTLENVGTTTLHVITVEHKG